MFDRRLIKNFDFLLLLIMLVLCAYGLLVVSSATQGLNAADPAAYLRRQVIWISLGLAGMFLALSIDYINYYRWALHLYVSNLLFLFLVLVMGREGGGAYRWLDLGIFDFQPSELAKLILIITLARMLVDYQDYVKKLTGVLPLLVHMLVPMLLIFLQPDLGTGLVLIVIFFGLLYMGGVPLKFLGLFIGAGLAVLPVLWAQLLEYQRMRLIVFLNPELDPLGYGYQLMQSMIAIGSGGLRGKGLFEGTQARLQFLPEQHTDFIFSVLGEELGLLGGSILLVFYFLLIYRILKIGALSKDSFGALLCTGIATMFTFQVLVNVGMTLGIMPVTGLPLPFMSYGGNAMMLNMISIGVVLNVGMRRFKIQF